MTATQIYPSRERRPISAEEEHLIRRSTEGDSFSFEKLAKQHRAGAYRFARSLTKDPDSAADITEESLTRAFRGVRGFRGTAGFATWLHRIVLNCFNDRRRKDSRLQTVSIDNLGQDENGDAIQLQLLSETGDPARILEQRERSRMLLHALSHLSETSRRLIILAHFEEVPYSEIAEREGIPIGTIKSRMHRARQAMRAHLVEENL